MEVLRNYNFFFLQVIRLSLLKGRQVRTMLYGLFYMPRPTRFFRTIASIGATMPVPSAPRLSPCLHLFRKLQKVVSYVEMLSLPWQASGTSYTHRLPHSSQHLMTSILVADRCSTACDNITMRWSRLNGR